MTIRQTAYSMIDSKPTKREHTMNYRILIMALCFVVFAVLIGSTGCKKKTQMEEPSPNVDAATNQDKIEEANSAQPQIEEPSPNVDAATNQDKKIEEANSAQSDLPNCPLVPNSPLFTEGQVVQITFADASCNWDEDGKTAPYPYLFRSKNRCESTDVSISEQSCKVHLLNASSESCEAQFICSESDKEPVILTITKNEISWKPYPTTNGEATGAEENKLVFQESSKESCKCPSECAEHCKAEPPECGMCEPDIDCDCSSFQNQESCKKCEDCLYNSFSIFCTTRSGTFREGDVWSFYGQGDGEFDEGDLIIYDPRGLFVVETSMSNTASAMHIRTPDYQCTSEDKFFCPVQYHR